MIMTRAGGGASQVESPPRVSKIQKTALGRRLSKESHRIAHHSTITTTHHTMPGQRGPVPVLAQAGGRDLTQEVLDLLDTKQSVATESDLPDVGQAEIKAALDRLASRNMVTYETNDQEQVVLTKEGEQIANEGSHEFKVWQAVNSKGQLPLKELPVIVPWKSDDD